MPLEELQNRTVREFLREKATMSAHRAQEYRQRFNNSVAFYCVASLLLGLGDRHRGNMLITSTGSFFHIDLEFALGEEAKGKSLAK